MSARHFFVYLFYFFLIFLKVAPEEKKLLGAKAKVAPEKSGKSGPKRKQGMYLKKITGGMQKGRKYVGTKGKRVY